jgi:prepilin-type N-terminal cleavage/methylation domain-containing protein
MQIKNKGNHYINPMIAKGFTLIEILVVVLIIGTLVSLATISLNTLSQSPSQKIFNQLSKQISQSKTTAKIKNIIVALIINTKKKQSTIFYFNSEQQKWLINKEIKPIKFDKTIVEVDVEKIEIKPNGFITQAIINIIDDDQILTINTNAP